MSHLPTLSDYVGKMKAKPASKAPGEPDNSSILVGTQPGNKDSSSTTNILRLDDDEMKNMFSGMSRSLGKSGARIARNKKVGTRQPMIFCRILSMIRIQTGWDHHSPGFSQCNHLSCIETLGILKLYVCVVNIGLVDTTHTNGVYILISPHKFRSDMCMQSSIFAWLFS